MKNEDDVIGNEITGGGSSSSGPLKSLLEVCPICGKEFSCNKTYHVYTALAGRRRQYYCSSITALNSGRIPKINYKTLKHRTFCTVFFYYAVVHR